ncbi:MAG TPA: alcohol dehydrogenase catalytic domain-containing protein [Alphaproteobacteria bacterium]|nr:alcohol dehydrogenase catalytic domain-containing protein [Alphaproteobacteria bacterium]
MRSEQIVAYGQPLTSNTADTPTPDGREVLIRVRNCGVCHSDVHLHDGHFELGDDKRLDLSSGRSLPFTLGHEVEGEVIAVGDQADGIAIGDRVVVYPWIGCDNCDICAAGDGHACNQPRAIGVNIDGGYSDHCLVPDAKYLLPYGDLSAALAATYACSGITAYGALEKAGVQTLAGPLLIVGLGGVGMMGLAFAKALTRGPVLVADIDAGKREAALAAGAAEAFDSADKAAIKALRGATGGGAAAVVDFVGSEASFTFADKCLGKGGHLVVVGLFGGRMGMPIPMFPLRNISISGSLVGSLAQFREMMALVRTGAVAPIPLTEKPLGDAGATLDALRTGQVLGRVVLTP